MPTVVVGVDNTDTSLHAARWAASLAAREDSELHIVGAYDASTSNYAPGLVIPQEVVEAIAGEAKDAVTNAASAALEAEPDLRIRTSVGEGDAARTLRIVRALEAVGESVTLPVWQLAEDVHALATVVTQTRGGMSLDTATKNAIIAEYATKPGDTGSAAEYAMRGKEGIRVFMLSPHEKMSPFQTAQMFSLQDPNIFNLAVRGVFDDCQDIVKAVSNDLASKRAHRIGTVNSINWARLLAQVVYYFAGVAGPRAVRIQKGVDTLVADTKLSRRKPPPPALFFVSTISGHLLTSPLSHSVSGWTKPSHPSHGETGRDQTGESQLILKSSRTSLRASASVIDPYCCTPSTSPR